MTDPERLCDASYRLVQDIKTPNSVSKDDVCPHQFTSKDDGSRERHDVSARETNRNWLAVACKPRQDVSIRLIGAGGCGGDGGGCARTQSKYKHHPFGSDCVSSRLPRTTRHASTCIQSEIPPQPDRNPPRHHHHVLSDVDNKINARRFLILRILMCCFHDEHL